MASLDSLPEGWTITALREVVSPSSEKVEPSGLSPVPYLSLEHIEAESTRILGHGTSAEVRSTKSVFRAGDVLYGKLRPYLNKVCCPAFGGVCSTDILVFPRLEHLDSKYLLYFLNRREIVEFAHHHSSGIQLPRIGFDALGELPFPLPPLAEQRRIVAKLEELLAQAHTTRGRLEKVPAILKRFRQSVLAAACTGRLTEEWREQHSWVTDAEGSDLPAGWRDGQLADLCESISDGDHQPPPKQEQGIPFLVIGNINSGSLDFSETRFVPEAYYESIKPIRKPRRGDVLYAVVGATIGISAPVLTNHPFCFQRHIAILKPNQNTDPAYLNLVMKTQDVRRQSWENVTGSAQPTLPLGALRSLKVTIPPLSEQNEIVRRVETLFAWADAVERRVEAAKARVEKLTQSVLAKAFRGELVPHEAELARREGRDYEPASVLLERIREQRSGRGATGRRRSRGKAAAGA